MRHALTGAFNSLDSDNDNNKAQRSNKESMSQSQVMQSATREKDLRKLNEREKRFNSSSFLVNVNDGDFSESPAKREFGYHGSTMNEMQSEGHSTMNVTSGLMSDAENKRRNREIKRHLKNLIPDSTNIDFETDVPTSVNDEQRIRYKQKFVNQAVDVKDVTDRVLRMCGNLREKSSKALTKQNMLKD